MGINESSKERVYSYQIRAFLGEAMRKYKYGLVTEDEFLTLLKEYLDGHSIAIINDKDLETVVGKMLPEMIAGLEKLSTSSFSPETDQKRRIGFWILFKDCDRLLKGSPLFSEERQEFLTTGRARKDEVEYSDQYLLIERDMEILVREEVGEDGGLGFCHIYWAAKKRVLKDNFGIDWRSLSDRYPGMMFD